MEGVLDKMRPLRKLSELGSFFPKSVKWRRGQGAVEADNRSLPALPFINVGLRTVAS
jgi:hypothetical protein